MTRVRLTVIAGAWLVSWVGLWLSDADPSAIALAGVVINSSLVLVDFINRNRRIHGMSLREAVVDSGMSRFRPIFLTSVTTFMGLMPLMVTRDFDTAPFVPLAVSLGFGVIFATAVTLILIPALYIILEDFLSLLRDDETSLELSNEPSAAP